LATVGGFIFTFIFSSIFIFPPLKSAASFLPNSLVRVVQLEVLKRLTCLRPANLSKRPGGMSSYQRLRVVQSAYQIRNRNGVLDVPQGDTNIAQQAPPLRPSNRAILKLPSKSLLVQSQ
jgi:hypothetical protein